MGESVSPLPGGPNRLPLSASERGPGGEVNHSHPRRPLVRRALHLVRRAHLVSGLFLLPWVVLYGVTAFLFNHPAAFADQPTTHFGRPAVAGTPLNTVPTPLDTATAVTAELARRGHAVTLVRPEAAAFGREFAFATVKADGQTVSVLVDAATGTGTIRSKADDPPKPAPPAASFAVGGKSSSPRTTPPPPADPVRTADPLHERMVAGLPTVLERCGFPTGPVTVTSSPDVVFFLLADGREWKTTYSPLTGAVTGVPADDVAPSARSTRQFLMRLHTAHGYPATPDARWWWAVVVDAMAAVMLFWAASGLVMWWQLRAVRRLGAVVLAVSAVAAAWLTLGLYARPA